jgi:hypothetical protein
MIELDELIDGLNYMVETEMVSYRIGAHKQMIRQSITQLKKIQTVIQMIDDDEPLAKQDIKRLLE